MSLFWLLAAGLTALALALVLPPLLRPATATPRGAAVRGGNLGILREQLAQVDAELAAGTLDAAQHARSRVEIERRALEEQGPGEPVAAARRSAPAAVVAALAIPCLAIGLYWQLGNPQAILKQPPAQHAGGAVQEPQGDVSMAQIEAMVAQMAQRIENPPPDQKPDAEAWNMLARAWASIQKFAEADRAYERAIELAPSNAQLLADRADLMALMQGRSVAGEPLRLVERALGLDPRNVKALALAGSAAFERNDFASAEKYWVQARALAPQGGEFVAGLDRSLEAARAGAAKPLATAKAQAVPPPVPVAASAGISGRVSLSPALAGKVSPGDTVFIFARAVDGPRMPLAILRHTVAELPVRFRLDDSTAMSPAMSMSRFTRVVVGVRVSKSGSATPQSGDLVGQVGPLATGVEGVELPIDGVQP